MPTQVTIVTGGGSGIGRAICIEIARQGGIVVVTDIDRGRAEAVAHEINEAGGQAQAYPMDVTDSGQVARVVERVQQAYGRVDAYYNNAGIAFAGEARDMAIDHWQRIVDVNLWGVIHGVQHAYRAMVEQGFGRLVNVASLAGIVANVHAPAYTTTKFAVVGLSKALRIEGEGLGIKVSVVCPGAIDTGIRDATPFLRTDREGFLRDLARMHEKKWFAKQWDAERAARTIVAQVEKGAFWIFVPPPAKAIRLVDRFFPGHVIRIQRRLLANFRRHRIPTETGAISVPRAGSRQAAPR